MAIDVTARDMAIAALKNGGGSGGVTIHSKLSGRDDINQHPINAITDLQEYLDKIIEDAPSDDKEYVRLNADWVTPSKDISHTSIEIIAEWKQQAGEIPSGASASGAAKYFLEWFDHHLFGDLVYFDIYDVFQFTTVATDLKFDSVFLLNEYLKTLDTNGMFLIKAYIKKNDLIKASTTAYNTAYSMLRGKKKLKSYKKYFETAYLEADDSSAKFIRKLTKIIYTHFLGVVMDDDDSLFTLFNITKANKRFNFPTPNKIGTFYGEINAEYVSAFVYNSTDNIFGYLGEYSNSEVQFQYADIKYFFVRTEDAEIDIRSEYKQADMMHGSSVLVVAHLTTHINGKDLHMFRIYSMGIDTILINNLTFAEDDVYNIYIKTQSPSHMPKYKLVQDDVAVNNLMYNRLYRVPCTALRPLIMDAFTMRNRGKYNEPEFSFIIYNKTTGVCTETDAFKLNNTPSTQCNRILYK